MKEHSPWAGRPVAPILAPHYRSPGGARVHQLVQQEPPSPPREWRRVSGQCGVLFETTSAQPAAHAVHKKERRGCQEPKNGPRHLSQKAPPPPITGAVCSPARRVSPTSILELSQPSAYDTVVGAGAPSGRADTSAV